MAAFNYRQPQQSPSEQSNYQKDCSATLFTTDFNLLHPRNRLITMWKIHFFVCDFYIMSNMTGSYVHMAPREKRLYNIIMFVYIMYILCIYYAQWLNFDGVEMELCTF